MGKEPKMKTIVSRRAAGHAEKKKYRIQVPDSNS
jgi:hypothetical protein